MNENKVQFLVFEKQKKKNIILKLNNENFYLEYYYDIIINIYI